jgi:regulator of replication initiation timing
LFCQVFRKNKKLNLELECIFSKIAFLRFVHDDMSVKPCDNCNMIMVNYVDLWLMHSQVTSRLKGGKLELKKIKACSTLLGAYTTCPLLRSDLEASPVEIKDLKHKLNHSSRYTILSPLCEMCGSLKGKLFHAIKENTELKQEVVYLTTRLEKTKVSEKMIEDDLSWVEEGAIKSTYKFGVGFERCENKG